METKVVYEASKQDLIDFCKEMLKSEVEEAVYSRFSNRLVTSLTVCEILGISKNTLYKYIQEGRIVPVTSANQQHKFDLSEVLKLDPKKFQRVANLNFVKQ